MYTHTRTHVRTHTPAHIRTHTHTHACSRRTLLINFCPLPCTACVLANRRQCTHVDRTTVTCTIFFIVLVYVIFPYGYAAHVKCIGDTIIYTSWYEELILDILATSAFLKKCNGGMHVYRDVQTSPLSNLCAFVTLFSFIMISIVKEIESLTWKKTD